MKLQYIHISLVLRSRLIVSLYTDTRKNVAAILATCECRLIIVCSSHTRACKEGQHTSKGERKSLFGRKRYSAVNDIHNKNKTAVVNPLLNSPKFCFVYHPQEDSHSKHRGKKEEMLVTSISPFFHDVLYSFRPRVLFSNL